MAKAPAGPIVALLFTQFSFASLAIAGKIALGGLSPIQLAGLRLFFASLFLGAIALLTQREMPTRADLAKLFVLSLLGIVCNQILFLEGLSRTTAINATILIAMIPVFTQFVAILVGKEQPRPVRILGIAVALSGALVLLEVERFSFTDQYALGNLLVVLNCLSYSMYLVFSRPLLHKYRSTTVVAWTFLFGALLIAPLAAIQLPRLQAQPVAGEIWWALAWIILVPSVLSYSLNNYALKRLQSSTVATYVFLQPFFGILLAIWILENESLTVRAAVGGALILLGLVLVTRSERVEPLVVIPESGEAMSRQPLAEEDGRPLPQPQEDGRPGAREEAP